MRELAVEILRPDLHPRDVVNAQRRAVGIGAQNDIAELLRRRKTSLRLQVQLELLVVANRPCADAADRRLDTLRTDCSNHIRGRKIEAC